MRRDRDNARRRIHWIIAWPRFSDRRKGQHQTRKNVLNLLRVALQEALDRELIGSNPARDVRLHAATRMMAEDDLDGTLNPAEQQRLLAAVPEGSRPMIVFALLTGIRQAEQWWLKPEDVSRASVTIRRSSRGKAPKNGKNRTVFLLEPAQRALELAPGDCDWVWPAPRGGRRAEGKAPRGWHRWVKAAKLRRRVRWHDLRHTCATSLLAGWWGRKWSLDEVCQMLGHSSVKVTERYARKFAETMRLAVAETLFPKSSPLLLPQIAKTAGKMRSRFRDLRVTKPLGSLPKLGWFGRFPLSYSKSAAEGRHDAARRNTLRHGSVGNMLATELGPACPDSARLTRAARKLEPSAFAFGHAPGLPIEPLHLQARDRHDQGCAFAGYDAIDRLPMLQQALRLLITGRR